MIARPYALRALKTDPHRCLGHHRRTQAPVPIPLGTLNIQGVVHQVKHPCQRSLARLRNEHVSDLQSLDSSLLRPADRLGVRKLRPSESCNSRMRHTRADVRSWFTKRTPSVMTYSHQTDRGLLHHPSVYFR